MRNNLDKKNSPSFSYEEFRTFILNKLACIIKPSNPDGSDERDWIIIYDSSDLIKIVPLDIMTQEEAIRWLYDNRKFEEVFQLLLKR